MNQNVEDYLKAALNAADPFGDLTPEVYTGTDKVLKEPDGHAVLLACESIENVIGPLGKAKVRLTAESNAARCERADHAAIAKALLGLLQSLPSPSSVGVTTINTHGIHITSLGDTGVNEKGHWVTSVEGTLGVSEADG